LADSTGIPYLDIMEFAMIPELVKAGCSMYGAWGKATKDSLEGSLI